MQYDAAALPPDSRELPARLPLISTAQFRVRPATMGELRSTVLCMNISGVCNADGIKMKFLKFCFGAIAHATLCVINTSLVTSTVPSRASPKEISLDGHF